MSNGRGADYYTTKGQGSQDSYDAYYDEYGDSSVWQHVNVDTQGNIAIVHHGGEREFKTTAQSIEEALGKPENKWLLLIGVVVAYNVFM